MLAGFIFFTNVDLTPTGKESLIRYAQGRNVSVIDIFDMERLRHVLDSSEGLIVRLQYLEIPMSPTEQASLVAKFGNQLQNAVITRFDRVERTLAQMERFLSFQKPLLRLDVYIALDQQISSVEIGDEAVLLRITGLHDISKTFAVLLINAVEHPKARSSIVTKSHMWTAENSKNIISPSPSISPHPSAMSSYNEVSIATAGNRVRIADLTLLSLEVFCTYGIRSKVIAVMVDANGLELFYRPPDAYGEATDVCWPESIPDNASARKWVRLVKSYERNLIFAPPESSGRFSPLEKIT